jgi:exopolyphosphatase/guanosine-5'-triphosphate,3'-diphosphate pyrophosphatase
MSEESPQNSATLLTNDAHQLAALDLGSNSFHLLITQEVQGRIQVVDKHKEMVRLAEGLTNNGLLSDEVSRRALECLHRLAQRLRSIDPDNLRVVGTNTLRQLEHDSSFIAEAEGILGHPIEIISGREEARLIYLGVCHGMGDNHTRQLVVDIGGGSTELIIGQNFTPKALESLHMGCVSMTRKHFQANANLASAVARAIDDARIELEPVTQTYLDRGWEHAIGASGTINSVASVQSAMGLGTEITSDTLKHIRQHILDHEDTRSLPGLSTERSDVFAAGLSILTALFEAFNIRTMEAAQSALREGVIYDLLGRQRHADIRDQTVANLSQRFTVDQQQAKRVKQTALDFFNQVADVQHKSVASQRQLLGWAADLHEIGMDISHNAYHKHGSYLLSHMDMPGFSRSEQAQLAILVGMHRRKITGTSSNWVTTLGVLLRLSAVIHRHRSIADMPVMSLTINSGDRLSLVLLSIDPGYLQEHPLTRLDLDNEVQMLRAINITLKISHLQD